MELDEPPRFDRLLFARAGHDYVIKRDAHLQKNVRHEQHYLKQHAGPSDDCPETDILG